MSKIAEATARPWGVEKPLMVMPMNTENCERIYAEDPGPENDFLIAYVRDIHTPTREANARLIVQAVNAHEALVSALKLARENIQFMPMPGVYEQIDAALKLAEGEETK